MKVTGSSIEQLEKDRPKGKCRKWRLWASTEQGRKSKRFTGTWTQATQALEAFVGELESTLVGTGAFAPYAESWLAYRLETGDVRASTARVYRTCLNAIGTTALASMPLGSIAPEDCRAALMEVKHERGLSNTTLRTVHAVIRLVMESARRDGKCAANPMADLARPSLDTDGRDALDLDGMRALFAALDAMPLDGRVMAVYLMAGLGLRRGEACAVLADGLDERRCVVAGSVSERDGGIGKTKTPAGVRTLPTPPVVAARLGEWEQVRAALGWSSAPTACCNTRGGVLHPTALQEWWKAHRDALGCPGMVMHQLRHSNLTMVARHMSAYDLQRYAGWSSIELALVYVHDDYSSMERGAREAWRALDAPNLHQ